MPKIIDLVRRRETTNAAQELRTILGAISQHAFQSAADLEILLLSDIEKGIESISQYIQRARHGPGNGALIDA